MSALLAALAACGEASSGTNGGDSGSAANRRSGAFGSLRDFVLFVRVDAPDLFVDRFEATQQDWLEFAQSPEGVAVGAPDVALVGRMSLPVAGMDLQQARAFALWRLGRLPSEDEWRLVTMGDGRNPFPWGSRADPTRANTGDLGLGEPTPVGTFESGRKQSGNAPYDLIGNVREWTETVPPRWCADRGLDVGQSFGGSLRAALHTRAFSVWQVVPGVVPAGVVVGIGGGAVPRKVVGADFETPIRGRFDDTTDVQGAGERRQRTGVRVYTTVDELLARLVARQDRPRPAEIEQLRRFVARAGHGEALREAFAASPFVGVELPPGTWAALVADLIHAPGDAAGSDGPGDGGPGGGAAGRAAGGAGRDGGR